MKVNPILIQKKKQLPFFILTFLALLVPFAISGCAYYNIYFNANKAYMEAEKSRKSKPEEEPGTTEKRLYNRSIKKCAKLIVDYPDSKWRDDAILLMGKSFYRKGDYDKAITKFIELRTLYPGSELLEEASYYEALTRMAKGDFDTALDYFRRLVKNRYPSPEIPILIADCYREKGEQDSALTAYVDFIGKSDNPDLVSRAVLSGGEAMMDGGDYAGALDFFKNHPLPSAAPRRDIFNLSIDKAHCLAAIGEDEQAVSLLDSIAADEAFFDFNDQTLLEMAVISSDSLSIEKSIEKKGLTGNDASEYRQSRLDRAVKLLRSVADRYPRTDSACMAQYRLGVILRDQFGDFDGAEKAFRASAREKPGSDTGETARKESRKIKELTLLQRKLRKEKDPVIKAELHLRMAELYAFEIGDSGKGLEEYNKAISAAPQSPWAAKSLLATAWIERYRFNERAKADSIYRVIIERFPGSDESAKAGIELGEQRQPTD